jgi:neurofibromin 1
VDDYGIDFSSAASQLEMTLLVSLCSADLDTCQLVTMCIGYFLEECSATEEASTTSRPAAGLLRNSAEFRKLASREFRLTGVVAFQKRVRNILRSLQFPTEGILSAWELGFEHWLHLARELPAATPGSVEPKTFTEWRNYSGFLASLGGICTAGQATLLEEPAVSGLRWIDRVASDDHDEPLLTRYLRLSVRLLACPDVRVREATREVLTAEISPTLYQPLLKALESELEALFTGRLSQDDRAYDAETVFAEQTSSLLRGLVERLDNPADLGTASSVHLGALTLDFAKFLDGMTDSTSVRKVKIKVCQLCEVVTKRKEHLNLRDDVRIRNQLLESIFRWISDPRSARIDDITPSRLDESARVQRDLDKACLRSLADLTYRLPLQPADGQGDAGTSELKSQMFLAYFTRFLSLLNYEPREASRSEPRVPSLTTREEGSTTSELAITILSNLLSANIDVGLKHSLNIGYHDNVEIRTAFVKVLYNILIQGTEFNNLSDAAVSEKYDGLLDVSCINPTDPKPSVANRILPSF